MCIRVACQLFSNCETCICYESKLDLSNIAVAKLFPMFTDDLRNWRLLYLVNIKGYSLNLKYLFFSYKELELKLRIKAYTILMC